ncbi:hypothetical protein HYH03_014063 [Edaphochlamys debaryana]|uniref:Mitochondrial import inner membrane translocase subunit tim16 n=1 Tax=Edaphochlamys debaryana TaxID=47281 RepID=A0A836BTY0_9CHLO|nr:hypothetical protein HYH03_014063 [Edaphochlamys debaryana]|eukprot:KAG2487348.1 hypothetical protein HYH03_014063 [Edaphochlamys debaryana]
MAARIIAQVVVAGATVVFRAATQAWAQALVNAQKSGVAQEAAQAGAQAIKKASTMAVQEAQMILEVKEGASWGDVVKRFKHLFEVNEKHGSFYLQSKVYRAREAIEEEYKRLGLFDPTVEAEELKGDQGSKEGQGQGGQKQ